ncbi:MAG: S8/S53 family peptidase, partial [Ginsengibacter sp.]
IPPELIKYHDKIPKIFLDFHLGKLWELPMQKGLKVGIIDNGVVKDDAIKTAIIDLNPTSQIRQDEFYYHGTTMACMIAGNDPEHGIIGIAPGIETIYSYKIPSENTTPKMFIDALDAMQIENVRLINMSCGFYEEDFSACIELQEKITQMANSGFLIVCSTGNLGINRKIFYPASCKNVISVTGLLIDHTQDYGSNFWEEVSLGSCSDHYFNIETEKFHHACGTSGAAAIITGCLARAYQLINFNNPLEYLRPILLKFETVSFSSTNLTVSIHQFDGELFIIQLKTKK